MNTLSAIDLLASSFILLLLLSPSSLWAMRDRGEEKRADPYALATGSRGSERLDKQAKFLRSSTLSHLDRAGIGPGMILWDLGCGNGAVTLDLAQKVGPEGHVYALDKSDAQLVTAKKKIAEHNLSNVTFIQGDLNDPSAFLGDLKNKADGAYMRFVLMHTTYP